MADLLEVVEGSVPRFLDLPQEIKVEILKYAFPAWQYSLSFPSPCTRPGPRPVCIGKKSNYDILRINKELGAIVKQIIANAPTTLTMTKQRHSDTYTKLPPNVTDGIRMYSMLQDNVSTIIFDRADVRGGDDVYCCVSNVVAMGEWPELQRIIVRHINERYVFNNAWDHPDAEETAEYKRLGDFKNGSNDGDMVYPVHLLSMYSAAQKLAESDCKAELYLESVVEWYAGGWGTWCYTVSYSVTFDTFRRPY